MECTKLAHPILPANTTLWEHAINRAFRRQLHCDLFNIMLIIGQFYQIANLRHFNRFSLLQHGHFLRY
jgi:hypothetical protein